MCGDCGLCARGPPVIHILIVNIMLDLAVLKGNNYSLQFGRTRNVQRPLKVPASPDPPFISFSGQVGGFSVDVTLMPSLGYRHATAHPAASSNSHVSAQRLSRLAQRPGCVYMPDMDMDMPTWSWLP